MSNRLGGKYAAVIGTKPKAFLRQKGEEISNDPFSFFLSDEYILGKPIGQKIEKHYGARKRSCKTN